MGVLREAEAGAKTAGRLFPSTRRIGGDALQPEGQVRRSRSIRGQASAGRRDV